MLGESKYSGHVPEPEEEDESPTVVSKLLVYEDDSYSQSLLQYLNTLRKTDKFCDVVLQVGSRTINAHRPVLACASVYFFELLSTQEGSTQQGYYELDIPFQSLEILVNYAYTSRLEVPADQVKAVYKTATLLKMPRVARACSDYLAEKLTVSNCLGIRSFANSHSDEDLTTKTDGFIHDNITDLLESSETSHLPCMQVDIVGLEEDGIEELSKWQLSKLAINWIQQQLAGQTLASLTEDPHVLYLTSENILQDCLDMSDDDDLSNVDIVTDYKKLSKRKQIGACSKNKDLPSPGGHGNSNKVAPSPRPPQEPKLEAEREWKLLASVMVGEKTCMCIAMLDNTLARVSLKFHSQPTSNGYNTDGSVSPPGSGSPRGSISSASVSRQCSLVPLAPLSSARCGVGTAVLDNKLIALGGYDRGECLPTVEVFDPQSNSWSPMQPMLSPRGRFDVSQLQGKLFACGGSDGSQELKSAECYDPETKKWVALPNMGASKSGVGVAVLDSRLYVVGGWTGRTSVAHCEMFCPDSQTWKRVANLNEGRYQAGVCVFDGQLIVVGGCNSWHCLNSVESYNPTSNQWMFLPPMTTARRGVGVAVFKDKLYVVGGTDGQSTLNTVEIYDPKTQTWSFGPSLGMSRSNVGVAVVANRLYAVGGFCGNAFLDSIEYLLEDGQEWCSFAPLACTPSDKVSSNGNASS